jgi:hypothetical protein
MEGSPLAVKEDIRDVQSQPRALLSARLEALIG